MKKFMDTVIDSSLSLWEDAANESFLQEMGKGTLDKAKFYDYIVQDSLYLRDYLKAYAMAIFKSKTLKDMQIFYSVLGFVNDGENVTRLKYLKDYGMTDEQVESVAKKQECIEYTDFLINTAVNEDLPEILMAVMPCMLGYYHAFKTLLDSYPNVMNTYYAPLVNDYTTDFYKQCCDTWTDYCNEVCENLDSARKEKLVQVFKEASVQELNFWKMAGK